MKLTKVNSWCEMMINEESANQSIEEYLKSFWQFPKKLLHEIRMEKGFKVNDEVKPWSTTLNNGDKISVLIFRDEEYDVIPQDLSIDICYEDDHLIVVNKPFGVDTHPNEKGQLNTLANGVAYHFQENGIQTKVRHIHRLDKDTSGGIVFAKHALSSAVLDAMLSQRKIKRTYTALVEGKLKSNTGTINEAIGRDRHHPTRRRVSNNGDKAITHFKKIDYLPKQDLTIVECQLDTGRTHQIRVHLSYLGNPIVGDQLYGSKKKILNRQALHASNIDLIHPFTKKRIIVSIPFPIDILKILKDK